MDLQLGYQRGNTYVSISSPPHGIWCQGVFSLRKYTVSCRTHGKRSLEIIRKGIEDVFVLCLGNKYTSFNCVHIH